MVVSQVNESFAARGRGMDVYLKVVRELILYFDKFELVQVLMANNDNADALSKLVSNRALFSDKEKAMKLKKRAAHFLLSDNVFTKEDTPCLSSDAWTTTRWTIYLERSMKEYAAITQEA
ncbi:Uncharacterized protein Adt_10525 [Abeliophyllum distichum]|uniref:Uncharacterized protein n=1 Tax=Abeliophyllum distichum TaxID=126358 RepID=A0ABD1UKI9_9LAMI